jgi:hypothetical protein
VVGTARCEPATSCLQSQIGQGRHLRRQGNVQVEATEALFVGVRWGPLRAAVNGTVVARPGEQVPARAMGEALQGNTSVVGKSPQAARQVGLGGGLRPEEL